MAERGQTGASGATGSGRPGVCTRRADLRHRGVAELAAGVAVACGARGGGGGRDDGANTRGEVAPGAATRAHGGCSGLSNSGGLTPEPVGRLGAHGSREGGPSGCELGRGRRRSRAGGKHGHGQGDGRVGSSRTLQSSTGRGRSEEHDERRRGEEEAEGLTVGCRGRGNGGRGGGRGRRGEEEAGRWGGGSRPAM